MEFRKMRRSRQQLSEDETVTILKSGKTAVLGVIGDGGYPYAVPVNYVYDDGKIFFHGARSGHKLDAIKRDGRVSMTVIDRDDVIAEQLTTYFRSVIVFGTARVLESDEETFHAAEVFGLKYNGDRNAVDREIRREWSGLSCVEVTIEHMTGKEAIELTRARGGTPAPEGA